MAQTITQKNDNNKAKVATGRYLDTGTVGAYTITLGFKPRYVRILNHGGNCIGEWIEGMAAASVQKVVDSGSGTTDLSLATSNGITVSDSGFIFGLDTDLNVTNEQVSWLAIG